MGFFPYGIELEHISSPLEILHEASREWESESNGVLSLRITSAEIESDIESVIDVYVLHIPSRRLKRIMSVAHMPSQCYPAEIRTEASSMPRYLQKSYKVRRTNPSEALLSIANQLQARNTMGEFETVKNQWVCDTPSEFREKLVEALNLGYVKSIITNILAGSFAQDLGDIPERDEPEMIPECEEQAGDSSD